jgi:hypothetical protein
MGGCSEIGNRDLIGQVLCNPMFPRRTMREGIPMKKINRNTLSSASCITFLQKFIFFRMVIFLTTSISFGYSPQKSVAISMVRVTKQQRWGQRFIIKFRIIHKISSKPTMVAEWVDRCDSFYLVLAD